MIKFIEKFSKLEKRVYRKKKFKKGFTLIEIIIVTAVIALLASIAIVSLLRSKLMANEASAQGSLRTISSSLESYRAANGSYSGATFNMLVNATPAYLDSVLGSGTKHGYNFSLTVEADEQSYFCAGVPENQDITGSRSFCVSDDGVIRVQAAGGAIATYAACLALNPT